MGMIRAIRMLNGLVDGLIDGPALETLLNGGRSGDFAQLLSVPSSVTILANSTTALQAALTAANASAKAKSVLASIPSAVSIILRSPLALGLIAASAGALAALLPVKGVPAQLIAAGVFDTVVGSQAITTLFLNNQDARRAVWDSDRALTALLQSPQGILGARAASGFVVTSDNVNQGSAIAQPNFTSASAAARRLVVGYGHNASGANQIVFIGGTVRAGTTLSLNTPSTNGSGSAIDTQAQKTFVLPALSGLLAYTNNNNMVLYLAHLPVTA